MRKAVFGGYLCLAFLSNSCTQQKAGFKTPEDAVHYLVQNVKSGNFENVLKTSSYYYDDIIDKLNAKEYAKRMNLITIPTPLNLPNEYHSLIKARFLGQHALNIQMFVSRLLLPEECGDFLDYKSLDLNTNEQLLDTYFSSLSNLKLLNSLELVRMDVSNPDVQYGERHQKNTEQNKRIYGFDERIEYTALFKNNNGYYIGGYTFGRYGSGWYILDYYSPLANQSTGFVPPISSIEDYLDEYNIESTSP
ncbi:MAG: hypothetical protein Pg6C_18420 [Treponemataceae bacterium]|nr:MAG: hypothetical protein Pg6C_18420 [Treponemataceae bacterium]